MALELLQLTNLQQELRATIGDSVAQLSVVLTDDAHIQPLNHRWRGVNRATDVLSFPMGEGGLLGDIVISVETARRRLRPEDWELQDELLFLLIHGLLHLLGYDHMEAAERREMEAAEQRLWTALGRVGTLRAAQS
ncbi:MAG: rRNA maturation RNase YbeY [Rickettsiales bacterium]|nr:rRNA maturation RNase YbeY [Rickettsiales bacterium]